MQRFFIVNPAAASCPTDIGDRIARRHPQATVSFTRCPGDGERLARWSLEQASEEPALIVACGGDGTFREVASAVGAQAPLGFVPLGTVNLVAHELGLPVRLDDALDVLSAGSHISIYPGRCRADGGAEERLFFIGVSAGPDADAVHQVGPGAKRRLGRYAYIVSFAARLARPVRPEVEYRCGEAGGRCAELLALRTPHYGGPFRISERCSLFTPLLEVIALRGGRATLAGFAVDLFRSRIRERPGVTRAVAEEVRVRLPASGRFQMDGDPFTGRELLVRADPAPLKVLAPEQ